MAANIVFSHISGGRAFLRFNASATINVVANSTANSDLSTANDQVLGATITKVLWSVTPNSTVNTISIARGANTIMTLTGTGSWDFKSMGIAETEYSGATIVVTMPPTSTLFIECSKLYANGTL